MNNYDEMKYRNRPDPEEKRRRKVYIAGKITGNPSYREEFDIAEKLIEREGGIAINPAKQPEGMEARDYMRNCMAMLTGADEILMLPTWTDSKGARIEKEMAEYIGIKVRFAT